jgi:hypothetical protein
MAAAASAGLRVALGGQESDDQGCHKDSPTQNAGS